MAKNNNANRIAGSLDSATTTVNVDQSSAPSTGQVLTATSATSATWQNVPGASPGNNSPFNYIDSNSFAVQEGFPIWYGPGVLTNIRGPTFSTNNTTAEACSGSFNYNVAVTGTSTGSSGFVSGDTVEYVGWMGIVGHTTLSSNKLMGFAFINVSAGSTVSTIWDKTGALDKIVVGVDSNGIIFLSTGSASAVNTINTGISGVSPFKFKIEYIAGTSCKLYVNGTQVAVSVAALPNSIDAMQMGKGTTTGSGSWIVFQRAGWYRYKSAIL